jgi:hypothetical protein
MKPSHQGSQLRPRHESLLEPERRAEGKEISKNASLRSDTRHSLAFAGIHAGKAKRN